VKCLKCKTELYDGMKECSRCGYSREEDLIVLQKEIDRYTISKNKFINNIYKKTFGYADKTIVFKLFKRLIIIIIFLLIISHFYLYIDLSHKCIVTIRPSFTEFSNLTMKKGIHYLKNNFPNQYDDFCKNINSIDPNVSCGGFGGGCYSSFKINPHMIDISTPYGYYKQAAKVIVHETCHSKQFFDKRPFDEGECYKADEIIPW